MKVLHLTSSLAYGGGMEKIIVDLISNNKDSQSFLCIINDNYSKLHLDKINSKNILLCKRTEGTKNIFKNVKVFYQIQKYLTKNSIKIIHCHDTFSLKIASMLKKILDINVVFTAHHSNLSKKIIKRYKVDHYVAISKSVLNSLNGINQSHISLIYNGINLEHYSNRIGHRNNERLTIACVARVIPSIKGQDILLKALEILKNKYNYTNFDCIFAGNIDDSEFLDLKELIDRLKLEDNVDFLGNIDDVRTVYKRSDICVLPSRSEGFGLVIVEALASGCKVIVSDLEGPLEIIQKEQKYGISFRTGDYESLAAKLWGLIPLVDYVNDADEKELRKYLDDKFSIAQMVKKYNEIYSNLNNGVFGN